MPDQTVPPPRLWLMAVLSAILLYSCFFPMNIGPLAWIALIPFFGFLRAETSPRKRYLVAFMLGLFFYVPVMRWIRVAHPMMNFSWIGLSIYCALYLPLTVFVLRRLDRRRIPLVLSAPLVWVTLEYCRAHFPTGFAWLEPLGLRHLTGFGWYFLGYSQHEWGALIQIVDITGMYGLTLLIVAVNVVLFQWVSRITFFHSLFRLPARVDSPKPIIATISVALLTGGFLVYGQSRLSEATFRDGPTIALLQTNWPQDIKSDKDDILLIGGVAMCDEAARSTPDRRPDLIVWPETTFPIDWIVHLPEFTPTDTEAELLKGFRKRNFEAMVPRWNTNILLGLNALDKWGAADAEYRRYNSALLVPKTGAYYRYDKMHLVPFGEYVPLREMFPWMQVFTPHKHDYSCTPGSVMTRFPLQTSVGNLTFGMLICYEDSDPSLAREYVRTDPVDFLINISNDGWFMGSAEHAQHLAICRFRAVECRRSVVRSVNTGISAIIDPNGKITAMPGDSYADSIQKEAIVRGMVRLDDRRSHYAQWGDWLPVGSGLTILLLWSGLRRRVDPLEIPG